MNIFDNKNNLNSPGIMPTQSTSMTKVLVNYRWLLLGCLIMVCGIAFAATKFREPCFHAKTQVKIIKDISKGPVAHNYFDEAFIRLRSPEVLALTVAKIKNSDVVTPLSRSEIMVFRNKKIITRKSKNWQMIEIVGVGETGYEAANIANSLASAFREISVSDRGALNKKNISLLKKQIGNFDAELYIKEEYLNKFREDNLITGDNSGLVEIKHRISLINNELINVEIRRESLKHKQEKIQSLLASGKGVTNNFTTITDIDMDHDVIGSRSKICELIQIEVRLALTYLPNHPKLRNLRIQIAGLRTSLVDYKHHLLSAHLEKSKQEYIDTINQEKGLVVLLKEKRDQGVALTALSQKYQRLIDELNQVKQFKFNIASLIRDYKLNDEMNGAPVEIIEIAQEPEFVSGLNDGQEAASILLLGILFSLAFVFAVDRFSQPPEMVSPYGAGQAMANGAMPMWSPDAYWGQMAGQPMAYSQRTVSQEGPSVQPQPEVAPQTDINQTNFAKVKYEPVISEPMIIKNNSEKTSASLVQLNNIRLGNSNLSNLAFAARCRIAHTDQSSTEASAFRSMGSSLIGRFSPSKQAIVVTSDKPNVGKTTCACNLALVIAKSGKKVLLIDANVDNPALHRIYNGNIQQPSFGTIAFDQSEIENASKDNDVPTLTVLPNVTGERLTDLEGYENVLNVLNHQYDWIIIDSGILTDETTVKFLQILGKCLCVTQSGESENKGEITDQIEHTGAVCIGFVENTYVTKSSAPSVSRV
jgi:Mrp family chromosome partitioning ATPase/uncharacterized protein involved in exopolysaccharide biosynthesis